MRNDVEDGESDSMLPCVTDTDATQELILCRILINSNLIQFISMRILKA